MNLKKTRYQKAAGLMEYAIVLGVIAAALMGMNVYVKRGLQGRLKEMTDNFISNQQQATVDPTASYSDTVAQSDATSEGFIGGGTRLALLDTKDSSATSTVFDRDVPFNSPFVTTDSINADVPVRDPNTDHIDRDWKKETDIDVLEAEKARLIREAAMKDQQAAELQAKGQEMLNGSHFSCPSHHGGSCRSARRNLRAQGNKLISDAATLRKEAAADRAQIIVIQTRIDQLRAGG